MKPLLYLAPRRLLLLAGLLLTLSRTQAAVDVFLEIPGVPGESTHSAHSKWINLESLDWGLRAATATNGPSASALTLGKRVDSASPLLYEACASGRHFPKATIDLVRTIERRARYYRITLEDVLVSSCRSQSAADASDQPPAEEVRLSFARVSWSYTEFSPEGAPGTETTAYWDQQTGTGGSSSRDAIRVSGAPVAGGGAMNLAFPGLQGRVYRVLGSDDPAGPYVEISRFTADTDGSVVHQAPIVGGRQFFVIEEVP